MIQPLGKESVGTMVRAVLSSALALGAGTAMAQESTPGTAAAQEEPAEVVVTGSRIKRAGFDTPTPTTVLDAEDLGRAAATNVGAIATMTPSFLPSTTPTGTVLTSNRAGGNYLNLRGLGDNRTLVLVNSRRFVPTNSESSVDTNVIPGALIERIDVVTGGASAAYGSDAVAGVVNVVLRRELDGFAGDLQGGTSRYSDNDSHKGSLAWGTAFMDGRGHFAIAAEGEKSGGIGRQTTRPWGRDGWAVMGNPSAAVPGNLVAPDVQYSLQTLGGLIVSGVLRGTEFGPGGAARPFVTGPSDGFNQLGGGGLRGADYLTLSVPYKRYSVYATGDLALTDTVTAFVEASNSWSQGNLPIIPASNFGGIVIQRDNTFLPAALAAQMLTAGETSFRMGRFFADLGPLTVQLTNRTNRVVAGLEGSLGETWKWDVYGEWGRTRATNARGNNWINSLFARSYDAVQGPQGPVCRVNLVTVTDPACVPVNLFGFGSPSAAARQYFLGTSLLESTIDQRVIAGSLNGEVAQFGDRAVSAAVGAEWRTDEVDAVADPISRQGGFAFGNPQSLSGKETVKEVFGEVLVPVLHDLPAFHSLDLNGAVRLTDYDRTGRVTTWKAGLTWDINEQVRLRATRSRDIRAPNLSELFGTSNVNFVSVRIPNTTTTVNVPNVTGGNANLEPERANTLTAGIVLTPSFVPNLRASLDYYDIKISGAVAVLSAQDTVNRCFAGDAYLCQFVERDGAGTITRIVTTNVNVAEQVAKGYDLEVSYSLPAPGFGDSPGTLGIRALANHVKEMSTANGGRFIDRAGEVGGNNNGLPKWRYTLQFTYDVGAFGFMAENRYVGGGKLDNAFGPDDVNINRVGSASYVNLGVQYSVPASFARKLQVYANINNVFDRDPPLAPSEAFAAAQTNAVLYDVVGRMYYAGVRFAF